LRTGRCDIRETRGIAERGLAELLYYESEKPLNTEPEHKCEIRELPFSDAEDLPSELPIRKSIIYANLSIASS